MTIFPTQRFAELETPFYYYDMDVLGETLQTIKELIAPTLTITCTMQLRRMRIHVLCKPLHKLV